MEISPLSVIFYAPQEHCGKQCWARTLCENIIMMLCMVYASCVGSSHLFTSDYNQKMVNNAVSADDNAFTPTSTDLLEITVTCVEPAFVIYTVVLIEIFFHIVIVAAKPRMNHRNISTSLTCLDG